MPAINANIIVDTTTLTVTPTTNSIGVTVDPINLNLFTNTSLSAPGGSGSELQYRTSGLTFGGIANTSVDASGNLVFSELANVKINGGVNGYVLQTDGAGDLSWTAQTGGGGGAGNPGGSNTQIQYNDSGAFGGKAGFTFNEATNLVSLPGDISVTGVITGDGGGLSNIIGSNVVGTVATATTAQTAQTVTTAAQPNITSTGTLTGLGVNGTITAVDITANTGLFTGDGGGLSNIAAANVSGLSLNKIVNGTSNVEIATTDGNVDFTVGSANVARMSTTGAAYPGVLAVNGNITAENDIETSGGNIVADTGNIVVTAGQFVGDGGGLSNISGSNLTGNVNTAAIFNGDGGGISNIAAANIVGGISSSELVNGTSNVKIPVADGNIEFSTNGIANVMRIFESAGAGFVTIPAGNSLSVSGNATLQGTLTTITAANISTANISTLNYPTAGEKTTLGRLSTAGVSGTAYGYNSSAPDVTSVAIGYNAQGKGQESISIGLSTASGGGQGARNISIGSNIAANTTGSSWGNAVKIGFRAGSNPRGSQTIAIGTDAGGDAGTGSGGQGQQAIGIGALAGHDAQGNYSLAIGYQAGNTSQGINSVAIGAFAGSGSQAANSICINGSGTGFSTATSDTFNVKPVRSILGGGLPTGFKQVAYNPTTGEFVYYD